MHYRVLDVQTPVVKTGKEVAMRKGYEHDEIENTCAYFLGDSVIDCGRVI